MKKVLFRADAHPSIGTGDLMSLIHLSEYFQDSEWDINFMVKDFPAARQILSQYNISNIEVIENHFSIADEVSVINRLIDKHHIDLIFFEITEKKLSEYKGISSSVYKACVSFDGSILPDMDLVVDWDVSADQFFKPELYQETIFLLGPKYVILPVSFDRNMIEKREHQVFPKKLLVCMGGADELNFTSKVVDVLIQNKIKMETTVIVGHGYTCKDSLEKQINKADFKCEIKQNVLNMFEEYMKCDVAVSAGGLTSYELIATRTPAVLIATYKHQIARCRYFNEKHWAIYLGFRSFETKKNIDAILKPPSICLENIFNTRSIVDVCNDIIFS